MEYTYIKDPRKFNNTYLKTIFKHTISPDSNLKLIDVSTKVEFMSPTKFLGLQLSKDGRFSEWLQLPREVERIESVKNKLQNQIPIDPLFMLISIKTNRIIFSDGTHRAIAAQELGIKKIPVYITYVEIVKDDKGKHFIVEESGEDLTWLTHDKTSTYGTDIRNKTLSKKYLSSPEIFEDLSKFEELERKKKRCKSKSKRKVIKKCKCK